LLQHSVSPNNTSDSPPYPLSRCGINALYSCLHHLGVNLTLDRLYDEIKPNHENKVNFYQLAQYARKCGLYVKAVKQPSISLIKKSLSADTAAIVQFKHPSGYDHIIALLRKQNNEIWVFDVPTIKFIADDKTLADLSKSSQGMLILSTAPFNVSILHRIVPSGLLWGFLVLTGIALVLIALVTLKVSKKSHINS
jgi:ABC-type bacteriocin/lantibiotic exporter with double-glycine peptidase domain